MAPRLAFTGTRAAGFRGVRTNTLSMGTTSRTGARAARQNLPISYNFAGFTIVWYTKAALAVRKNPAGGIEFRDPGGRGIDRAGQIPALCPSLDITERMRDRYEDLFIDANTCMPQYTSGGYRLGSMGSEWADELMPA